MKRRVEEAWREFEARVLASPTIGATQRRETRRAFYAGAFVLLDTLAQSMSNDDDMTPGDEQVMIDLAAERELYLADLRAGRA